MLEEAARPRAERREDMVLMLLVVVMVLLASCFVTRFEVEEVLRRLKAQ